MYGTRIDNSHSYTTKLATGVGSETKKITIDYTPAANENAAVEIYGWNVEGQVIGIK